MSIKNPSCVINISDISTNRTPLCLSANDRNFTPLSPLLRKSAYLCTLSILVLICTASTSTIGTAAWFIWTENKVQSVMGGQSKRDVILDQAAPKWFVIVAWREDKLTMSQTRPCCCYSYDYAVTHNASIRWLILAISHGWLELLSDHQQTSVIRENVWNHDCTSNLFFLKLSNNVWSSMQPDVLL